MLQKIPKLRIILLSVLISMSTAGFSQVTISGPSCVVAGTTSLYNYGGSYNGSTTMTWCVTNGTIQQAYGSNITGSGSCRSGSAVGSIAVLFSSAGSGVVQLSSSNGSAPNFYVTIVNALNPGTITANSSQTIAYNSTPATISCSLATYGACSPSYSYQWQQSLDNVSWTNMTQTTQNLAFTAPIFVTTYYRRMVTEISTSTVKYTATATAFVNAPPFAAGTIAPPPTPDIYTGSVPATLTGSSPTGGACGGSYTYQWQYSTNGGSSYAPVTGGTGANSLSYTPAALTLTTYFKRADICSGTTVYTNAVVVNVYQHLNAGTISTPSQTITYNTDPGYIVISSTTGGICSSPTYQWQKSIDNGATYTDISGATSYLNYDPGLLTAKTYFRRKVVCGETAYSNAVIITVNPQLFTGNITPTIFSIPSGTSPGYISANPASGGGCSGSYSYQWQKSADNITFTDIAGATSLNYNPGNITASTYFRRKVICGTDQLYTNSCQVIVGLVSSYNYIQSRTITKPGVTDEASAAALVNLSDVKQNTQYFDGLGRLIQTVDRQANPSKTDMVTPYVYDQFGREVIKYLPYVSAANDGNYKPSAIGEQNTFNNTQFPGEQYYYSRTDYEPSPLNTVTASYAPGISWTGSNKGIAINNWSNTSTDAVRIWTVTDVANSFGTYASSGAYLPGSLYKSVTIDENGKQVVEFKDKLGRTLLKKIQLTAAADNGAGSGYPGWLSTYYIYDDYNNLRCVVQPAGVNTISGPWQLTDATVLAEQCFRYEYDSRNRMIMKKVPGAGEVDMVYDNRDRLVMTQDANLKALGKWMVTLYDNNLDRIVQTGLWNNSQTLAYHAGQAYNNYSGYPFATAPGTGWETLTLLHYDDYLGLPSGLSSTISAVNSVNLITQYNTSPIYALPVPSTANFQTRGMVTWKQVKVLNTASQFNSSANIYDEKGRPVQSQNINITGGLDITTFQYDFSGKVLSEDVKHQKLTGVVQNYELATKNSYDDFGRLLKVEKMLNSGGTWKQVSILTYNTLGQLFTKGLGVNPLNTSNPLETLTYDYNIRGWLLGINRNYVKDVGTNYFGFELGYDKAGSIIAGQSYTPALNGNISGTIWKSAGDGEKRKYDFAYDAANRLTGADFNQYTGGSFNKSASYDFSVSNLTYDANGNIITQQQKGLKLSASDYIDNLTYTYIPGTNRLQNVIDLANNSLTTLGDFRYSPTYSTALGGTKTASATDYSYDVNGNLTADKNKDITSIVYNYLNLPQTIVVSAKGSIEYVYDAEGNKLKKIVHETSKPDKTTLYLFGTYQDDVLQFLPQEEGRIRYVPVSGATPASFQYDYFIKDHLGNVRMMLTEEQKTNYYPAATLEGLNDGTSNSMINYEKTFYNITNAYITPETSIPSWPTETVANTKLYYNNNGNPPANLSYPAGCTPAQTAGSNNLYKLNATTNKTGLEFMMKVMAGDHVDIFGKSYYLNTTTVSNGNSTALDLISLMTNFLLAPSNAAVGKGITAAQLNTLNSATFPNSSFFRGNNNETGTTVPKAYINYIFLDEQFKFVSGNASRVGTSSTVKDHWQADAQLQNITVPKNGYIFVYVSNESNFDVFFDNLQVIHKPGPLLEETHYYPFGLTMAEISSRAAVSLTNKYKYNGKELNSNEFSDGSGLEAYDYGARMQDPQLGRWYTIDPMANKFLNETPYNYGGNNPINLIDVGGNFKMSSKDQQKYSVLASYLKNGISEILGSKNIMGALMKYGQFTEKQIRDKIVKWGKGSIAIEFKNIEQNGRYDYGKGDFPITINSLLAQQLQDAKPEDRQAALLAVLSTILHESTHYGDWNADGLRNEDYVKFFNKDGYEEAETKEVGELFEIFAYHGGDFYSNRNSKKRGKEGIEDMKKIIERKEATEDEKKDLPHMVGSSTANLINNALSQNPNIKLYIQ